MKNKDNQKFAPLKRVLSPDYFWLLLFIFILTQSFTTNFVSNVLVRYIFRHFPSEGFTPIGAILLTILFLGVLVYLWIKLWRTNYIIENFPFLIGSASIVIFLLYHRFGSGLYTFYPFVSSYSGKIRMVDLPIFVVTIMVIILIVNLLRTKKKNDKTDQYIKADVPIKKTEDDEFNRKVVFESLLDTISTNAIDEDKSLAIALVNRWGEGKTSFLNMLDGKLKRKNDTLVVSFNLWLSSQPDNLTIDFFNTLDKALSPYIYTGRLFRQYAQSLTKIDTVYNPLLYLPRQWLGHRSHQGYFDRIKDLIQKLNKRIYILIDDMDRLHPKEVFELLRMIRNSASFPHMIFIVPFEREYVVQALQENRISNGSEYLKKIFDVEISLPPITFNYIQDLLKSEFEEILDSISISQENKEKLSNQFDLCIDESTEKSRQASNNERYKKIRELIKSEIKNRRDVIRHLNSLRIILKDNHPRIYFPDLLILELLKIKNIREYRDLFEKYDSILLEKFQEDIKDFFNQKQEGVNDEKSTKEKNNDEISELKRLLFQTPQDDFNSEHAFCHALNMSNYLEYRVEGVSQKELLKLYEEGKDRELIEIEKNNPILERLEIYTKTNSFFPQMDAYIKIALFYSKDTEIASHYRYYRVAYLLSVKMISYLIENEKDFNKSINIIKISLERMPEHYWISTLNKQLIDTIQKEIWNNIRIEDSQEMKDSVDSLLEELQTINEDFLQSSIDKNQPFSRIENIFGNCVEGYDVQREPIFTKSALEIFKKYINSQPEEYLKHFIRKKIPNTLYSPSSYFYHIPPYYHEKIFSSFDDWLKSIKDEVDSKLFNDIEEFIRKPKEKSDRKRYPSLNLYAPTNSDNYDMKLTYSEHQKVNPKCLPPKNDQNHSSPK